MKISIKKTAVFSVAILFICAIALYAMADDDHIGGGDQSGPPDFPDDHPYQRAEPGDNEQGKEPPFPNNDFTNTPAATNSPVIIPPKKHFGGHDKEQAPEPDFPDRGTTNSPASPH